MNKVRDDITLSPSIGVGKFEEPTDLNFVCEIDSKKVYAKLCNLESGEEAVTFFIEDNGTVRPVNGEEYGEIKRLLTVNDLYREIDHFIQDNLQPEILFQKSVESYLEDFEKPESFISKILKKMEKSFSDRLMEMIREKGLNEVTVYKNAYIDRRHFSKIKSDSNYKPTKETVILLCLSMKLSYEEAEDLLKRAGVALSKSSKQDLISEYFLQNKIYDVLLYKDILYKFGLLK